MNPTAFTILGLEIKWYGILIATGMLLGLFVANYTCKIRKVNYDDLLTAVLIILPISFIGARLYYVIFIYENYHSFIDVINIREGGLAIHGGIITAIITTLVYCKIKKFRFLDFADVAAPSIILAQALGRWGNFFNGEAHGGPVSEEFINHFPKFIAEGMNINGVYYHPTFLYESIWNIVIFAILIYLLIKVKRVGVVFFTYIGLYSLGRMFIEGLRTDSLMLGPIRVAQLVSIIGVVVSIFYLVLIKKKDKN